MIIDTHTHIGKIDKFNMPEKMLLESMNKYHINYVLISNIEGIEFDNDQKLIPKELQHSQKEINEAAIKFAKDYPDRIGVLLWTRPYTEGCSEEFERMIIENRDVVFGIKFHPFHSNTPFDSPEVEEYIKLAEKYHLTVVVHTAASFESSPGEVYKMASKYPKVNFVMVHMGLGSDNEKAIDYISKLSNLYGDTTWVKSENSLKMIRKCGIDKLLIGTDNPIDGVDTYANPFYQSYFNGFKNELSSEDYNKLMYKNAVRLFCLPMDKINENID